MLSTKVISNFSLNTFWITLKLGRNNFQKVVNEIVWVAFSLKAFFFVVKNTDCEWFPMMRLCYHLSDFGALIGKGVYLACFYNPKGNCYFQMFLFSIFVIVASLTKRIEFYREGWKKEYGTWWGIFRKFLTEIRFFLCVNNFGGQDSRSSY